MAYIIFHYKMLHKAKFKSYLQFPMLIPNNKYQFLKECKHGLQRKGKQNRIQWNLHWIKNYESGGSPSCRSYDSLSTIENMAHVKLTLILKGPCNWDFSPLISKLYTSWSLKTLWKINFCPLTTKKIPKKLKSWCYASLRNRQ